MWLPPFKIIKGLFAVSGQFTLDNGSDYVGPYHSTVDNGNFTGSEPSKDSKKLNPTLERIAASDPFVDTHNDLKKARVELVYPVPENYKRGFFIRYFVNDTRNGDIVEVNEKSYKRYAKELYIKGATVKWILEKPLKDIFMSGFLYKGAATRNIENVNEASFKIPNLKEYITDYGQFVEIESDVEGFKFEELPRKEQQRLIRKVRPNFQEAPLKKVAPRFGKLKDVEVKAKSNLYTPGGRFIIKGTKQEYKGFYHIHPEKGAMEGAVHKKEFHRKLVPISSTMDVNSPDIAPISTGNNTNLNLTGGSGGSQPQTSTYTEPSLGGSSSGGGGSSSGGGGSSSGGGGGGYGGGY